jgi:endothelin-converting enzyme/putative endopeptidase
MSWSRPTLLFIAFIALVAGAAASLAQSPPPSTHSAAHEALNPEATDAIAAVTHFDPSSLDRSVQPCDDFYQFSCGAWLAKNPIPADRARWDRLDELTERNQHILRAILEKAASPAGHRGTVDQKIGDYYASCMDEAAVEARGIGPLQGELDRIRAIKTKQEIAAALAKLHGDDVDALFRFGPQPLFKNASVYGAVVDQAGTALPDRDYYLLDDRRFLEIRKQYPGHVQRMLELLGEPKEAAARDAQTVLDVETALARVQLDRVKRRDPKNRDHRMTRAELAALAPGFDWNAYFAATGAPTFADLNVGWPDFFKGMNELLAARSVDDWKAYLRWHTVHAAAPFLPAAFVNENFNFFDKTLRGTKELRPRWKRCVELTNRQLGEALGQPYVVETFGPEGKERMSKMVVALESALDRDIRSLPWMTDATKQRALEKRAAIANKIGYPDHWRDYSKLNIVRGDAFGNGTRAIAFENARNLAKIGHPVDLSEWTMTPPTVNANYSPSQNNVNFPAGILQPPFFDKTMDDAVNFGAIGSAIGHELTHGFDDQGRKFDAKGNLTDWWTAEDAKEFEQRATCLADQYTAFTVAGDTHLNGRLTLGENTADNGGVRIAYMAFEETQKGKTPEPRDGFTPEQRFFLGWGQTWCDQATDENARLRAQTDPHSPGRYRVNGVMQNSPEFQKAWNCAPKAPMVRENACRVW